MKKYELEKRKRHATEEQLWCIIFYFICYLKKYYYIINYLY